LLEMALHLSMGPLHESGRYRVVVLELRPIDERPGDAVFLPEVLERVVGRQEGSLAEQLVEQVVSGEVLTRLQSRREPVGNVADLGVEDELLQRHAALEVMHARPRNAVDPCQAGQVQPPAGLEARLGVEGLAIAHADVGLGGQPQVLAHFNVGAIDHLRLHGRNGGRHRAHVEHARRAAVKDRRAGAGGLGDDDAAERLDSVLDDAPDKGDRRNESRQRHGDELHGNAQLGAPGGVVGRCGAPLQRRAGAAREDGKGFCSQRLGGTSHGKVHLGHHVEALDRERAGDDRLAGGLQQRVQTNAVADGLRHVVGHDGRGGVVDRVKLLDELSAAEHVVGRDRTHPVGLFVQHLDGRRAGREVYVVAREVAETVAGDVPQFDPARRRPDGRLDHLARHPDALAVGIEDTAGLGKSSRQRLVMQRDPLGLKQLVRLVEDPLDQFVAEESQPWPHVVALSCLLFALYSSHSQSISARKNCCRPQRSAD
jgi:hypothetical protein